MSLHPFTFPICDSPFPTPQRRMTYSQVEQLCELPNAVLVERAQHGMDVRFIIYFEGFTDEQVYNGDLRRWVEQQLRELAQVGAHAS